MSWRQLVRYCSVCLSLLVLSGCFEQPVVQTLRLEFFDTGEVEVTADTTIDDSNSVGQNEQLERRVGDLRRALTEGWDEWSPRFDRLEAASESASWRKVENRLTRFSRSAVLTDPQDLDGFFQDTGLGVFFESDEEYSELTLYPGNTGGATRRQRRRLDEAFTAWTEHVQAYVASLGRLYAYLEHRPERAALCFAMLLDDQIDEENLTDLGEPTAEEEELLEEAAAAMLEIMGALLIDHGEALSLNELAYLVYDPFPARIEVRLPGRAIEHEGFAEGIDDTLVIDRLGLWEALETLEGRWARPDPVLIYVRAQEADAEIDLPVLAARERWADSAVFTPEVRQAIEEQLHPEVAYRVVWETLELPDL